MTRWVSAILLAGISVAVVAAGAANADVVISKKATANMSCVSGVCSPTAGKATLNVTDLTNMLASGDVKVVTGSGATNIVVKDGFSWTSASRLTLDAMQSVEFDKKVTVAGTGAVTIATNDGGSGGDLLFGDKGNVTFWDTSSSLVIGGNSYTLGSDIKTLAADIAANPSGFYALAKDYDASVDGTYSSSPVTTELTGTFEGLGHQISRLSINSSDSLVGLFSLVSGTLRDIGVSHLSITGNTSGTVGGLLARSKLATILSCHASGSITTDNAKLVGGLVGNVWSVSDGTVTRSHTDIAIEALHATAAGGLVGQSGFSISLSYSTGNIIAGDGASIGGLVGLMALGGSIERSNVVAKVVAGNNGNVGGLAGLASGSIENTYTMGPVSSGSGGTIGGLAGAISGTRLRSSYSTGHVKGGSISGGFIGNGMGSDDLGFDYWDTETSGKSRREGYGECHDSNCGRAIKGLKTETFQAGLPPGFDPAIWGERKDINGGFPFLLANPPSKERGRETPSQAPNQSHR